MPHSKVNFKSSGEKTSPISYLSEEEIGMISS
jgi:hypothetical protein